MTSSFENLFWSQQGPRPRPRLTAQPPKPDWTSLNHQFQNKEATVNWIFQQVKLDKSQTVEFGVNNIRDMESVPRECNR